MSFERLRASPVRKRVWNVGRFVFLGGLLVLTFGISFLAAFAVAARARDVNVPDLRGKTTEEASAMLTAAGLAMKVDPVRRRRPHRAGRPRAGAGT